MQQWSNDYVPSVRHEMWLAQKVYGEKWMLFFQGVTTLTCRCQRMRETITLLDMSSKTIGKNDTFASAFERLYREPLVLPQTDVNWLDELREETI